MLAYAAISDVLNNSIRYTEATIAILNILEIPKSFILYHPKYSNTLNIYFVKIWKLLNIWHTNPKIKYTLKNQAEIPEELFNLFWKYKHEQRLLKRAKQKKNKKKSRFNQDFRYNARTGIRTRVGASTGLHDRPLHYSDIADDFACEHP